MTSSDSINRTEALLALILLQGMGEASQIDKAAVLSGAGFSNAEIAGLLGTTTAVVAQSLYVKRSAKPKRAATKQARKGARK